MANYKANTHGNEITVTFPDAGRPKRWARNGETVPNGFVISVMDMAGCDGSGSIMVKIETLTPGTRTIAYDVCHDNRGTDEYGDTHERAGVRFYIGDDRT